jgi:Phosphopantetheine attachment site
MDSLDSVEAVMALEEVLEIEIPDSAAERFASPSEVVNYLERCLSGQRPGKQAAALIEGLVNSQNNPQLAEGLDGQWRREQISAVVRELFQSQGWGDWLDSSDPDAPVRAPLNPQPHPRSGAARVFPDQEQ